MLSMKFRSNLLSFLSLLITVILVQGNNNSVSVLHSAGNQCPPLSFYSDTKKLCECYSIAYTGDIVKCTDHDVLLRFGYCITFKKGEGFYIGPCNYFDLSKYNISDMMNYIRLPKIISELTDYMCKPLNRGDMCAQYTDRGQCIAGYRLSVTSQYRFSGKYM